MEEEIKLLGGPLDGAPIRASQIRDGEYRFSETRPGGGGRNGLYRMGDDGDLRWVGWTEEKL